VKVASSAGLVRVPDRGNRVIEAQKLTGWMGMQDQVGILFGRCLRQLAEIQRGRIFREIGAVAGPLQDCDIGQVGQAARGFERRKKPGHFRAVVMQVDAVRRLLPDESPR